MQLHIATTEEILARSAGEVLNRASFAGNAAVAGGLFDEEVFGSYTPTRCGCLHASLILAPGSTCPNCGKPVSLVEQKWGPLAHIVLAEPVLHPLAHALFANLVAAPVDQITALASGDRLWITSRQPWTGGLLNTTGSLYYDDNAKDAESALTTIGAMRELFAQAKARDPSGLYARMKQSGIANSEALFLGAVPVLSSLARGIRGACRELDMLYSAVIFNKEPFEHFTTAMPFSFYRLVSAKCAKSVHDLFDLKRDTLATPKRLPDTRLSLRNYLEASVGGSLPLCLAAWRAEMAIPDTFRHRALVQSLALSID